MDSALLELTEILLKSGMNRIEIDHLLARFLEEEAFDYVNYMRTIMEEYELDIDSELKPFNKKLLS